MDISKTPNNGHYRLSTRALVLDKTRTRFLAAQTKTGRWTVPGGGIDWHESLEEGLRREIKEEMGLDATFISRSPAYFSLGLRDDGVWAANVFYETEFEHLDFVPSDECIAIKFVTSEEARSMNFYRKAFDGFLESFDPANHKKCAS